MLVQFVLPTPVVALEMCGLLVHRLRYICQCNVGCGLSRTRCARCERRTKSKHQAQHQHRTLTPTLRLTTAAHLCKCRERTGLPVSFVLSLLPQRPPSPALRGNAGGARASKPHRDNMDFRNAVEVGPPGETSATIHSAIQTTYIDCVS